MPFLLLYEPLNPQKMIRGMIEAYTFALETFLTSLLSFRVT